MAIIALLRSARSVVCRSRSSDFEDLNQRKPSGETPDVRSIGNAALLRSTAENAKTTNNLKHKPESNRDERRHLRHKPGKDDSHAVCGEQQEVTAQYAGNRS